MSKPIIDIQGTLNNIRATGFSTLDVVKEAWDNSFAKELCTKNVKIIIKEKYISFVDDGNGMTEDELYNANILNRNKNVSTEQQGLFGYGLKALIANITQLKYPAVIVSKSKNGLAEVVTDYCKAIQLGELRIIATSRMSIEGTQIWNNDSIDPESHGTVISFNGPHDFPPNFDINSFKYKLGYTYNFENINMEVDFYGVLHKIIPFDYIFRDKSKNKNKILIVYKNGDDIKISNEDGKYMDFNHKGGPLVNKTLPDNYTEVGTFVVTGAYHDNWTQLEKDIGYETRTKYAYQNQEECGTLISRNGRVLNFLPDHKLSHGDTWKLKYHNLFRTIVEYSANTILDDLVKLNINKSNISRQKLNGYLDNAIKKIRLDMILEIIKDLTPTPTPPTVAAPTPPVQTPVRTPVAAPTPPVQRPPPYSPTPIERPSQCSQVYERFTQEYPDIPFKTFLGLWIFFKNNP